MPLLKRSNVCGSQIKANTTLYVVAASQTEPLEVGCLQLVSPGENGGSGGHATLFAPLRDDQATRAGFPLAPYKGNWGRWRPLRRIPFTVPFSPFMGMTR